MYINKARVRLNINSKNVYIYCIYIYIELKSILNRIEGQELDRMANLKTILHTSGLEYEKMLITLARLKEGLQESINQINIHSDLQSFIRKNSKCATHQTELAQLYKNMGESALARAFTIKETGGKNETDNREVQTQAKIAAEHQYQKDFTGKLKIITDELKEQRKKIHEISKELSIIPNIGILKGIKNECLHSEVNEVSMRELMFILLALRSGYYSGIKNDPGGEKADCDPGGEEAYCLRVKLIHGDMRPFHYGLLSGIYIYIYIV